MEDYDRFDLGDVTLQSGGVLKAAFLAYKTYGTLNLARDNVVLMPTFYTGTHIRNEAYFGKGRAIDPARHFVVSINMIGNGYSISPSNAEATQRGHRFTNVTIYDNVVMQRRLMTERLGISRIALVVGWSMGAMQAYHWGALYPDMVAAILPMCGAARCSPHNHAVLDGPKAALQADAAWHEGNYSSPPELGLRAFGRVFVAWAYSQAFFRNGLYRTMGFRTMEDLVRDWEADYFACDANNLITQIWTWQNADISRNGTYAGDFARALGAIKARSIVMPCRTDLYFPPDDNAAEVAQMPNAELRVFESDWGHCAASPGRLPEFGRALDAAAAELLAA